MHPDEILALFRAHWTGTEEELEEALEAFWKDIRDTVKLTLSGPNALTEPLSIEIANSVLETADSYLEAHYF